jgi:DNA-binding MarR family transcriptional regulator
VTDNFAGLGTQIRTALELMEGDISAVLTDLGVLDYRPRFAPIVRALNIRGPMSIRDLARATGVTHSAASQTIAQMAKVDLVTLGRGQDARERIVSLKDRTRALLPVLEAEWDAAAAASDELDAELPYPLKELIPALLAALERRPFRERIAGFVSKDPRAGGGAGDKAE